MANKGPKNLSSPTPQSKLQKVAQKSGAKGQRQVDLSNDGLKGK